MTLFDLDAERDRLEQKHPGWQVWYVPLAVGGVLWCAQRRPTLQERTPAELEKAIAAVETKPGPG